jgi:hypothetical protein
MLKGQMKETNAYHLAGRTGQVRATLAVLLEIDPNHRPALDLLDSLDS